MKNIKLLIVGLLLGSCAPADKEKAENQEKKIAESFALSMLPPDVEIIKDIGSPNGQVDNHWFIVKIEGSKYIYRLNSNYDRTTEVLTPYIETK